jgi:DivIVA domain-containing protein
MSTNNVTDRAFRHTRFRGGYATHEVDVFIDAVEDALRSPTPRLGAADVAGQVFTPVLFKPGYHMGDVDDYLTEAEHLLSEREHLVP